MTTYTQAALPLEFLISCGNGQISFEKVTIAAAASAMVAGTVLGKITASGKYSIYANGAADGTEVADAVLAYDVADSASDQSATVIARLAEVKEAVLNWGANDATGITNGKADLAAKLVFVRAA